MGEINNLLIQYGYIVLFIAPMLETLALPIPGELLMLYCGVLVYTGKLSLFLSIATAALGVASGFTIAYIIGKIIGIKFFVKYGRYFGMNIYKVQKVSNWFDGYGSRLLLISCFIPGVRHVTGYFSGIVKIHYKKFALNGYIGAFLWVSTFIYLGDILGGDIEDAEVYLTKYIILIVIIIAFAIFTFYIIKKYRKTIKYFIYKKTMWAVEKFSSKVKIIPVIFSVASFGILILVVNVLQDVNIINFDKLNEIFNIIIINTFNTGSYYMMVIFKILGSIYFVGIIVLFLIFYTIKKGKNKSIDLGFIFLSCLGGLILQLILNYNMMYANNKTIFMISEIFNNYRDEMGILTIIGYGMLLRFFFKYNLKKITRNIAIVIIFMIWLFTGISTVFLNIDSLTRILFNFIIGFIWLFINIILFYIEEIIQKTSPKKH